MVKIRSISPYLVRMRENADQNNRPSGHFLRSEILHLHLLHKESLLCSCISFLFFDYCFSVLWLVNSQNSLNPRSLSRKAILLITAFTICIIFMFLFYLSVSYDCRRKLISSNWSRHLLTATQVLWDHGFRYFARNNVTLKMLQWCPLNTKFRWIWIWWDSHQCFCFV